MKKVKTKKNININASTKNIEKSHERKEGKCRRNNRNMTWKGEIRKAKKKKKAKANNQFYLKLLQHLQFSSPFAGIERTVGEMYFVVLTPSTVFFMFTG